MEKMERDEREDSKCLLDTPSQLNLKSRDPNQPRSFYQVTITGPKIT